MACLAYRLVGPHPQATHFLCDAEAELPVAAINAGDTAYAKDTGRLFRRGSAAWIESVPVGHSHVTGDVGGLQTALDARELVANRGVAGGYAILDGAGRLPAGQLCSHGHPQIDVTNLVPDLAGKAATVHAHAQADISGLVADLAARPAFQVLHKTADETRRLTTLADCGGLGFQAAVNASYGFLITAVFQTAATTVGPKFSMNGPAGGLLTSWRSEIEVTGGPSTSAVNVRSVTVPDTEHVVASVDQANTSRVARLHGAWRNGGNPGTVTLRFGSEVSGTNITVKQGSWGLVFHLP